MGIGAITLFLAACCCLALAFSANSTAIAPSCIMYIDAWNGDTSSLVSSPSKVYIFAFLLVTGTSGPVQVQKFDAALTLTRAHVDTLHASGKVVLLSFGGSTMGYPHFKYLSSEENQNALAKQLADIVNALGADGVDIDYEDTAGLQGIAGYNGIDFLVGITNKLAASLSPGRNIITHAPQGPYLDPAITGYLINPPYKPIMQRTNRAITWLNIQFYNNPGFQEITYIPHLYSQIVGNSTQAYVTQEQAVLGKPVSQGDAGNGYFTIPQLVSVVQQMIRAYPRMGGVFGWQFSSDRSAAWQTAVANALK